MQESKSESKSRITEWMLIDLVVKTTDSIQIIGKPGIVNFNKNQAVSFNGSSDAIFLERMPLTGY